MLRLLYWESVKLYIVSDDDVPLDYMNIAEPGEIRKEYELELKKVKPFFW